MTEWAWGIDSSSTTAGFAAVNMHSGRFSSMSCDLRVDISTGETATGEAGKLVTLYKRLCTFLAAMRGHYPPGLIVVERPTGKHPNPIVGMAAGVTLLACVHVNPTAPRPWLIPVGTWKKLAVGHGNASKADTIRWATGNGAGPAATEHEADALGIAVAGLHEFARGASFDVPALRPIVDRKAA